VEVTALLNAQSPDACRLNRARLLKTLEVKKDLLALGIDPENYRVLKLLPLVYVAWADGRMESVERQRIVALARDHFRIGESGALLLEYWLAAPLPAGYVERGLSDLLALAFSPDEFEIDVDELPLLLAHAEAIARTTAAALDAPWAISPEEEAALTQVARLLRVDNGVSWAALLRELDSGRRRPAGEEQPPHRWS
jgi:hypothetical protein